MDGTLVNRFRTSTSICWEDADWSGRRDSLGVYWSVAPMVYYLPIVATLAVSVARMLEVKRKRDTVAGPVRENLTFRLFYLVGAVMTVGSVIEYVLRGSFSWIAFAAGMVCAVASF